MRTASSNHQRVLRILIEGHKEWYPAYDFVGDKFGTFLSHRGPARVSEIARDYPEMIETDTRQKTYKYRMRFENTYEFLKVVPIKMRQFIKEELIRCGRTYDYDEQIVIHNPDRSVTLGKIRVTSQI